MAKAEESQGQRNEAQTRSVLASYFDIAYWMLGGARRQVPAQYSKAVHTAQYHLDSMLGKGRQRGLEAALIWPGAVPANGQGETREQEPSTNGRAPFFRTAWGLVCCCTCACAVLGVETSENRGP